MVLTFSAKIGKEVKVHIPNIIVSDNSISESDIIKFQLKINGDNYNAFGKVSVCRRSGRKNEYVASLRNYTIPKNVHASIRMKKLCENFNTLENKFHVSNIFDTYRYTRKNTVVVLHGNGIPLITSDRFDKNALALYLGCYFSDGTKKGTYWRINASTFEQAKFYIKVHKTMVRNSNLQFRLTYSMKDGEIDSNYLIGKWKNNSGAEIEKKKINMLPVIGNPLKWNKYGSLNIYENGLAILILYKKLMNLVINEIVEKQNRELAIDFLCGILEGDGTVNAKQRGHIQIATNKEDIKIVEKILHAARIKYKSVIENNQKYYIRIGTLEILRNFYLLKDKIFSYYPKRRKALFDRLQTTGVVKFLIGENHVPASWVKTWLKENSFVGENYKLTKSGLKLRRDLIKCINNVK